MKAKLCLMALASLLLAGLPTYAGAVPQAVVAAPAVAAAAAPALNVTAGTISPATPELCPATGLAAAPLLDPAPRKLTASVCGTCGTPVCRGVTEGSVCLIQGMKVYTCVPALGNTCSDGADSCQCWYGPFP